MGPAEANVMAEEDADCQHLLGTQAGMRRICVGATVLPFYYPPPIGHT